MGAVVPTTAFPAAVADSMVVATKAEVDSI